MAPTSVVNNRGSLAVTVFKIFHKTVKSAFPNVNLKLSVIRVSFMYVFPKFLDDVSLYY